MKRELYLQLRMSLIGNIGCNILTLTWQKHKRNVQIQNSPLNAHHMLEILENHHYLDLKFDLRFIFS